MVSAFHKQPALSEGQEATAEPGFSMEEVFCKYPTNPRFKHMKAALRQFSSHDDTISLSRFQVKCATVAVLGQKPTRVRLVFLTT
jgi:hypothetical protein